MKDYKAEGIIIKVRDYNESDRIVTLFTKEYGKIQAIAKGCRKQKSRKRGIIQLFTHGEFSLYQGRTLDTIIQCESKETFPVLREDLDRMAYGVYMAEVLDGFIPAGEVHKEIFYLFLVILHVLTVEDYELVARVFETRLMNLLGYQPHLDNCVNCGLPIDGTKVVFSSSMGGCLCENCHSIDSEGIVCSMGTLNTLKKLSVWDIKKLRVIKVSDTVKKEINQIMTSYIEQRLEKKLKSADFLQFLASTQITG